MPRAAAADTSHQTHQTQEDRQDRSTVQVQPGQGLSKTQAQMLRPTLVKAVSQLSGDMDQVLTHTNRAGAVAEFWAMDSMEAGALADLWLDQARDNPVIAAALVEFVSKWRYYQAGIILLPRFWQTWGFYANFGFAMPLPEPVKQRQRKARKASQSPQPPVPPSAPVAPAGLPDTRVPPQARAAQPGPAAPAPQGSPLQARLAPRPPVDPHEAEQRMEAHMRALANLRNPGAQHEADQAERLAGFPAAAADGASPTGPDAQGSQETGEASL